MEGLKKEDRKKKALGVSTEGFPTDRALPGMRPNRIGWSMLVAFPDGESASTSPGNAPRA
jgi:hypothetical protein